MNIKDIEEFIKRMKAVINVGKVEVNCNDKNMEKNMKEKLNKFFNEVGE